MNSGYDFSGISEEMLGAYLEGTLTSAEAAMVSAEMDGNRDLAQLAREVQATEDSTDWEATPYDDDPYFDDNFALPDLEEYEMDDPFTDSFDDTADAYFEHDGVGQDDSEAPYGGNDESTGYEYAQEDGYGEHPHEEMPEDMPLGEDYAMGDVGGDTIIDNGFDTGFDAIDDVVF